MVGSPGVRMNAAALKARIERAKHRLETAEDQMQKGLRQIGEAPRPEKSIISSALNTAFTELKAARQELIELERVIAEEV